MNANDAAAFRTLVLLCLLYDERVDSIVLYERQVLDHAHTVFCAIALIQLFQSRAGLFAFKTKHEFALIYRLTVFNPASNARRQLLCIVATAAGTFIFVSQISHANTAVHPAWGDQLCVECSLHFPLVNSYRFNDKRSRTFYPELVVTAHIRGGRRQSNRI
jgi:hypothetical protein